MTNKHKIFKVDEFIYFISDDEIKKGDWFIDGGKLYNAFRYDFKDSSGNFVLNIPNEPMDDFSKIIATNNPELHVRECSNQIENWGKKFVPKIPQSFIEYYNEHQPKEVELEYDECIDLCGGFCCGECTHTNEKWPQLRLQNNEVIIALSEEAKQEFKIII